MLRVYAAALGVDMASIQWVANIYIIVTCAALLVFGRLGDMYGKVRIFQPGVALFTLGSALCALSGTFEMFVFSRAVQSLGGAASLANNQGIITETFPNNRGRALGLVATFTALGAMCGPTLGGFARQPHALLGAVARHHGGFGAALRRHVRFYRMPRDKLRRGAPGRVYDGMHTAFMASSVHRGRERDTRKQTWRNARSAE